MKKLFRIMVAMIAVMSLSACGKFGHHATTQHEVSQEAATKLEVNTKSKTTNALGNVLISIKTNPNATVQIIDSKTKKTKNFSADADGKLVYNGHLDKKTKSLVFKISATAKNHAKSEVIKLKIKNNSDAYQKWQSDQAAAASEESTVDDSILDESSSESSSSTSDQNDNTDTGSTPSWNGGGTTGGNYTPSYNGGGTGGGQSSGGSTGGNSSANTSNDSTADTDSGTDTGTSAETIDAENLVQSAVSATN